MVASTKDAHKDAPMSRRRRIIIWSLITISFLLLLSIGAYEAIAANFFNALLVWQLEKL